MKNGGGDSESIGYKYESINSKANIIENSGGAFMHLFICIFFAALIFVLEKTKLKNIILLLFDHFFAGFIV